jgi:hypothetical protein
MQIDDMLATFTTRVTLLDPSLQRIGYGCYHDVGKGWRCVLNPNDGRGNARIVRFPAPGQADVPLAGFDPVAGAKNPGFPISVTFPQQATVGRAEARLIDAVDKDVDIHISSPENPLNAKLQRNTIGVHPLIALQAGQTYRVTVAAIVNGKAWRESWQFTTQK